MILFLQGNSNHFKITTSGEEPVRFLNRHTQLHKENESVDEKYRNFFFERTLHCYVVT